jgi:hypothetical protein
VEGPGEGHDWFGYFHHFDPYIQVLSGALVAEDYPDRIGLISLEETAHMMSISDSTVKAWRRIGRIPDTCVVRVSPRKYMYVEVEIARIVDKGEVYDAKGWMLE